MYLHGTTPRPPRRSDSSSQSTITTLDRSHRRNPWPQNSVIAALALAGILHGSLTAQSRSAPPATTLDLATLTASEGFVIYGEESLDSLGTSVSGAGDVNGDGFGDIIVGAHFAGGPSNARPVAGASVVLFGNADGLSSVDVLGLSAGAGFVVHGADANDASARVSGAGDLNGDGFAEVLIGSRYADGPANARQYGGEMVALFGKASGLGTLDLASLAPADGVKLFGADAYDNLGYNVSGAGDINGDGLADWIVGAPFADSVVNGRSAAGDTVVLFGKTSGLANVDLAALNPSDGFLIQGISADDYSGARVSGVGDVNGDGIDDMVVAAMSADGPADSRSGAGEFYILFGKTTGHSNVDLTTLTPADGFVVYHPEALDHAADVSSAGDVNGDGYGDIFFGAYAADGPANSRLGAGECYVVFGKATGFGASIDLATLAPTDGFQILGAEAYDRLAFSLNSAGDFNGDGYSDLIMGARTASGPSNSRYTGGEAYIVFGKPTTVGPIDLGVLGSTDGIIIYGADAMDQAGARVSGAGDFNGDGFSDVVVGAYSAAGPANSRNGCGEAYLLYGNGTAPSATYRAFAQPGNAPLLAVGSTGEGSDTGSHASRCTIDFDAGDNGSGAASLQTVTVTRSDSSITNLSDTANVHWQIASNRTGWTSAGLTFKYTDDEIAGLTEADLKVFHAPALSGPWTELPTTLQTDRNTASVTTSSFSFFALAAPAVSSVGDWDVLER